jgi:UDP-3-O-[3-hydroxymyristoyl] glucosamine N-acyltransferase
VANELTLREIADAVGGTVVGNPDRRISGLQPLDLAGPEHLSFLHNPRYAAQAQSSEAGAVIVASADMLAGRDLLVCPEPYLAMARALELVHPPRPLRPGVHASAWVDPTASVADDAEVGPFVTVGEGAAVGERSRIDAGCVIGAHAAVGSECHLHPRVVVEERCRVGDRCILHAGVVIGSDGYGFATSGGIHHKVPQVGVAVIEDDVELGANVCVDRGTLGQTRVGRGTKVDNLVQIAHNVSVGEGCLLVAQVGISGSSRLGDHVVLGGQAGVVGHVVIGARSRISARAVVAKSVPEDAWVTGNPARPHREWLRANANLARVDKLRQRVEVLEAALADKRGE